MAEPGMAQTRKPAGNKGKQRKPRVLQARIPEHLDEELRGRAEQLGLSVSTVVRNVLLNTFNLVEDVVSDSARIARAVQGRNPVAQALVTESTLALPAEPGAIIGWHEATLNRNGVCEDCNTILERGVRAAIGVPTGHRPALLCLACLGKLGGQASGPDEEGEL
ncbi:hypothetical protein Q6D67_14505 [Haliea sp. E1-2-M8]|uniref:hypothetical protein n=1 Tax=Haliea sp. E1-2-M8 TaxID=3064706 RepID=UPI00271CF97D|nr:hypothetical protein [Haliea sp. E1-2-M8]MDO8862917.1 hypothetical protein [Haliea sp. E1-2-M8]